MTEPMIPVRDVLLQSLSQALQHPNEDGSLPDKHEGVRACLYIPPATPDAKGIECMVDFLPPGDTQVIVSYGSFAVVLTRDGCALVLCKPWIDAIKNFEPEHTRLGCTFDPKNVEGMKRLLDASYEYFPKPKPEASA